MEKYLKIALGIIILIVLVQVGLLILPWVLGGILVLWIAGWIYFKFIRKYVIEYREKKGECEEYTYTFTNEEKKTEAEYEDDGPVIDVDFEEVKDDK